MDFDKVIKNRYSTRVFSDKKVEKSVIEKILNDIRTAPTGKNKQPYQVFVIESEENLKKVDNVTVCRFNAPLVLAFLGDNTNPCIMPDGRRLLETDMAIVTTYALLSIENQGLGACWVCRFSKENFVKEFNLPPHLEPFNFIMVGYKTEESVRNEKMSYRREIEEFTTYM